jgi:hypothetical protein
MAQRVVAGEHVWAEIETRGAYTPASGTAYELQVGMVELSL